MTNKIYTEEKGEYLRNNPTWHIEDSPWKARQVRKMLDRHSINPLSVAEIGCGAGEILHQLYLSMPGNVVFTGYDISSDAINFARQRTKDRLTFKLENLLDTRDTFDLLLMMDVFEHVDDYLGFLRQCKTKSAYTIFHIPLEVTVMGVLRNHLVNSRKAFGHLHYFTKETALATLVECGYEIVDYFYTAGALDMPKNNLHTKLTYVPRKLLFNMNPAIAAKLLGGFSLLVLAK